MLFEWILMRPAALPSPEQLLQLHAPVRDPVAQSPSDRTQLDCEGTQSVDSVTQREARKIVLSE